MAGRLCLEIIKWVFAISGANTVKNKPKPVVNRPLGYLKTRKLQAPIYILFIYYLENCIIHALIQIHIKFTLYSLWFNVLSRKIIKLYVSVGPTIPLYGIGFPENKSANQLIW